MADQGEQYEKSWILHHILDRYIGSPEVIAAKRMMILIHDCVGEKHHKSGVLIVSTGSFAEGMTMEGSDIDYMFIDNTVRVLCPFEDSCITGDTKDKTVFMMRDADSRTGYVTLELVNLGMTYINSINESIVQVRDKFFLSSEIFIRFQADKIGDCMQLTADTHGPATCLKFVYDDLTKDGDVVYSFPCTRWPREANEWVSRTRLHGWPDKVLRDEIVRGGCHLVPVGDKTSADTFLQWRISFTTAERKLMYSLSHTQFLIYGLLKYLLKQISDRLKQVFGEEDILSSYIIKTVLLYAVEITPCSIWQEKNTFFCFMLCLQNLIALVKAGHCPNYFISKNNMFHGKIYGENQQKLLHILVGLYDMKWNCLSVGSVIQPSLGNRLQNVRNGAFEFVLRPPTMLERERDFNIIPKAIVQSANSGELLMPLSLLSKSKSDIDEFLAYTSTVRALCCRGMDTFKKHIPAKGNKEKYKLLRKCKTLMTPLSSVCTSPGQLTLATYHYQTGNYIKALQLSGQMVSAFKIYVNAEKDLTLYEHLYCGRGYTLLQKCKKVFVSDVFFTSTSLQFCPSQLHPELTNSAIRENLVIPPLPYAVFLTFLCYHELGDTRRRDTALIHLQSVKYDAAQGAAKHYIVHNLLGACYEMVGDIHRALREYRESLDVRDFRQYLNPARERIQRLQKYQ